MRKCRKDNMLSQFGLHRAGWAAAAPAPLAARSSQVSIRLIGRGRSGNARCDRRFGAFTLSELIVAVGILALMIALAGQVFSITVRSTGQATALTEVNQRLRLMEQTLREDLAHVRSDTSLLVIQGNPIKAYWTAGGRDADDAAKDPTDGYPHVSDPEREVDDGNGNMILTPPRADVLMFVTQRTGARSVVFPDVTANAQQVVYGHALLTEYLPDASAPLSGYKSELPQEVKLDPQNGEFISKATRIQFPVDREDNNDSPAVRPASQWHLARRAVLLTPEDVPPRTPDGKEWWDSQLYDTPNDDGDYPLLAGLTDVVGYFKYDGKDGPLAPAPLPPATIFDPGWIDDDRLVATDYNQRRRWLNRSILDATLPAPIADRIGHYMLPQCASFKVEWTIDPAYFDGPPSFGGSDRVIWFDSDDSQKQTGEKNVFKTLQRELDRLEILKQQNDLEPGEERRYQRRADQLNFLINNTNSPVNDPRFPKGDNGQTLEDVPGIFWFPKVVLLNPQGQGPQRRDGALVTQRDRVFPFALRITVDVFDDNLRLDRPVRHVMVIPLGA